MPVQAWKKVGGYSFAWNSYWSEAPTSGSPRGEVFAEATKPQERVATVALADASASPRPASKHTWTGADGQWVTVGDRQYHLPFTFLGPPDTGCDAQATVDPQLSLAEWSDEVVQSEALTSYSEFSDAERHGYLLWQSSGRSWQNVNQRFLLFFLLGAECGVIRDQDSASAPGLRSALKSLIMLHPKKQGFKKQAQALVRACDLLDPSFKPATVYPTPAPNNDSDFKWEIKLHLGTMLHRWERLDAEDCLTWYLQQPGRHPAEDEIGYFRELHSIWAAKFSSAFPDRLAVPLDGPTLKYEYRALNDSFTRTFETGLPDIGKIELPPELGALFESCLEELASHASQPVGRRGGHRMIDYKKAVKRAQPLLLPAAGCRKQLQDLVPGSEPVCIRLEQVLTEFFDVKDLDRNKIIPAQLRDQMTATLEELHFGFSPDPRYRTPGKLTPQSTVALFRAEHLPFEEPSDAYELAQTAIVLSALSAADFPGLLPMKAAAIEPRLPYRHRFTDRELRRLDATHAALSGTKGSRKLLEDWGRRIRRYGSVANVEIGFGIAFQGQTSNPSLQKYAEAASLALWGNRSFASAYCKAARKAPPLPQPRRPGHAIVVDLKSVQGAGRPPEMHTNSASYAEDELKPQEPAFRPQSIIKDLDRRCALILIRLLDGPLERSRFMELAKANRIAGAAAIERINEWSSAAFGRAAIEGTDTLTVNAAVAEAVQKLREGA